MHTSATTRFVLLGDISTDVLVHSSTPLQHASDNPSQIEFLPGGSAANQASCLAGFNCEVHLVGAVGTDWMGVAHERALIASGVTVHLRKVGHLRTGCTAVLVDETGERTMFPDRGANSALLPTDVPESLLRAGSHLHVSGYSLLNDSTRPAALAAIALARERRLPWSVDPASASLLVNVGPARFRDWVRDATLCFPNLDEGAVLTGKDDVAGITSELGQDYGVLVLKLGRDGACVVSNGETIEAPPSPVGPAGIVDTTGAGDAFCAAFLATWVRSDSLSAALKEASAAAARAVTHVGAREANATWHKMLTAAPNGLPVRLTRSSTAV